jgi:hypothetical protein
MYTNLVNAGFPSTIGMLIDTALEEHWNEKSRQKTSRGEKRATSRQIVDLECL